MRMTTTALTTIVIGGLLSLATVVSAQPPEARTQGPGQPGQRGPASQPPRPPAPPADADSGGPSTNRSEPNVILEELIQRVADETGRTFLIDPRAPTRIYVGGTIEGTPSYPVLLSILRIHGLMTFETEGIVNVIPDGLARAMPTRLVQADDDSIPDDEIVTRVLTLPDNVAAAQLVPLLRPMMPQYGHLTATPGPIGFGQDAQDAPGANTIVMIDTYANVKRLTEVIRLMVGSVTL